MKNQNTNRVGWILVCVCTLGISFLAGTVFKENHQIKQSGAIPVEQAKHPVANRFSVADIDSTGVNLIVDTKTGCEYFKSGGDGDAKVTFVRNSCRVEVSPGDK